MRPPASSIKAVVQRTGDGLGRVFDAAANAPGWVLAVAAVAAFAALSLTGMAGTSATFDESEHMASGCAILSRGDYRVDPIGPPLVRSLAALPLVLRGARLPVDSEEWRSGSIHPFGFLFLYQSGNDPVRFLRTSRLVILLLGAAAVCAAFVFSRAINGPRGAVLTLVLAAFSPNLGAHSHLATLDMGAALFFLLAVFTFWRLSRRVTLGGLAAAGLCLGLALASKMSALVLVPASALAALTFVLAGGRWRLEGRLSRWSRPEKRSQLVCAAVILAIVFVSAYAVLWGTYRFRYSMSESPIELTWEYPDSRPGLRERALGFARDHRLLPEAYLFGLHRLHSVVRGDEPGRVAYALGRTSGAGWWWYFPFAFLVKTPVPFLLLAGLALFGLARRGSREDLRRWCFVLIPLGLLAAGAMSSRYDLGVRHLLPAYPLLMVAAGGAGRFLRSRGLTAALLACSIAGGVLSAPGSIAYFNFPAAALFDRHYMLVESNLDWGQDLPRLKRWMDDNGVPEVKLAYFGSASPRLHGVRHQVLPAYNVYTRYEDEWKRAPGIRPGDWVAVSATMLRLGLEGKRDLYRPFRDIEPAAELGHSILVYKVP